MGVKYDKKGNAIYTVDKGIDLNHKAKFDKSKIQMSSAQRKSYADDKKKKNKKTKQTKSQAAKRNSGITGGAAQAAKEYRKKNPKKKTEKKKNTAREYSKKIRDQKLTSNEKLLLQNLTRTGSPEVVRKGLQSAGKTLTTSKAKTKEYKNLNKRVAKQDEKFLNSSPAAYGFMAGSSPIPLKETLERQTGKKINTKKAEKSRGYKAGYMGGLMAEYTLTGGLARASAQKGIEIGAKQLAKNTSKKAIAKVVKKSEKLPKAVKRISSGLAADTITGLPTNALEAGKESMTAGKGEKGKTFAKSLALNTALDVGFGGAMEALPAAVKGAKAAKASRSSYIPKEVVPKESRKVYKEYIRSNDKGVAKFAEKAQAGELSKRASYKLSDVTADEAERLKELTGVDTTGYTHSLKANTVDEHIMKRHGAKGSADSSMADINDLSRINYIIKNADDVEVAKNANGTVDLSREFLNSDGSGAPKIKYTKKIDGHYYVVEAVPDSGKKKIQVVTAYIEKPGIKKTVHQVGDVTNAPPRTSETGLNDTVFDNSVAPIDRTVNDTGAKKAADQLVDVSRTPSSHAHDAVGATANNSISPVKEASKNVPEELPDARKFMSPETQEKVFKAVENRSGVKIEFADLPEGIEGTYSNGVIKISNKADNPAYTVMKHELTHSIENSGHYEAFADFVEKNLRERGIDVDGAVKEIIDGYKLSGKELTEAEARKEFTAKFAGEFLFNSEKSIERLARENPSLFRQVYDWIVDTVQKLGASSDVRFLIDAQRKYEKALRTTGGNPAAGNIFYSLKTFEDGKRFVDVDTDTSAFDGLSRREQGQLAAKIIKEKYAGKVVGIDNPIFVNGRGAGEFGFPLNKLGNAEHSAKMKSATELDNMFDAGHNFRNVPDGADGHIHDDVTGGFDYHDVIFKVGDRYYEGRINVKNTERGKLFKDITKIKDVTEDISSSYGSNPKSTFLRTSSMKGNALNPGVQHSDIGDSFENSILGKSLKVNDSDGNKLTEKQREYFKDSKAKDKDGRLLSLYHQTEEEFTVFDPQHKGAGTSDNGTPFGIFLKSSDQDIGLRGKKQMKLYANITNPLKAGSREELMIKLKKMSPEYAQIVEEHKKLDGEYKRKHSDATKELKDFIIDWRKNNPKANSAALYDIPEFNRLYNAEDKIAEEWTKKADELSIEAKEVLTHSLRDNGYDGVFLGSDAGRWGRSTDAFIALDPEQVKNIDNLNPTTDKDIRFSVGKGLKDENGVYNRLRKASERLYGEEGNKYLPDARNIKMVEADNELPAVENTNMGTWGTKNTGEREPIENVFEGKASINEEWKALEASQDDDKRWQTFINDFAETREYDTKTTGMGLAQTAENISNKGVSRGKDIQRNADAAFAHDPAGRQAFKRNVEDPLYISKGRYAKAVQRKTDDLYNYVVKKLGIKKGSKESAAVQWYGEGLKVEKVDGKLKEIPYTLEDLKKDYSYTAKNGRPAWENIVEAEKYTRKLYDEYFDRLQKTLIEIYPDVEKNVEKLEKKLADLKSGTRVKRIEKRIADAKAKGQTDEELQDVYEALERAKDEMSEAGVKKIEREIFDAKNNKRLYKRNDYFRHFKDLQNGFFKDLSDIMNSSTDIDPRLLNLSEFTQPKSKWTGFLQKREGALGYKADAIGGLLEYIPQAEYKINIEPNIPNLRNAIKELQLATYKSKNANKFIDELVQVANDLAGKTNKIDRIPGMLLGDKKGRQLINGLTNISNRIRANAVVGNFNTVLAQFFNMPNVVAYAKNPADIVSGMSTSLRAVMGDKNAKEILDKSMFLKERYLDRSMRRFNTGVLDNVNNFCGWMLEIGDKAVADAAFCTFYKQAKRKGLPELEAVLKADELTRKSVAGRGIAEMPLSQKAKLTKLLAPFQVEVRNSVNVMTELIGKKDAAGLIALFGLSWMMNEALDATTGRRIIFDPIEVLKNGYEEYREDENLEEAAKNTAANMFGEILTNIPGGTYAADIISDTMGISDLQKAKLFGENDPTRYGTGNIALQTLLKPAAQAIQGKNVDLLTPSLSLALPFGGKQIQRTMSGMQDMGVLPDARLNFNDGINFEFSRNEMPGSYSDSGNLRFAIDPTEANYITAGTLGTWSTKQGKEYLKAGSSPLSERQTAAAKGAYKAGMKPSEAEAFIRNLPKKAQDARGQIYRSNLTNAQKNAIGKAIDDGDKTVDYSSKTSYKYSMLNKQQKEKVDELRDKGFTKESALKIRETVKGQSSQMAQVMALEGTGYDTPEVYAALGIKKSKRGNGPREKAKMLSSQGLSIHDFDAVKEAADVNSSGNVSIEEAMAFLDDTAYTRQECYALTFALTGCKHGNNPYR